MTDEPVPLKKIQLANRRHPFLRQRPRGFWYPEAVGIVPGYYKTQEAFDKASAQCREQVIRLNAKGVMGRGGVPNGWGRLKKEAIQERKDAVVRAEGVYKEMVEKDIIEPAAIGSIDDQRAELAMIHVLAMMLDQTNTTAARQRSQETILAYCKAKPATVTAIKLNAAEDFLSSLLGQPD